jgi:hypothetical protein
MQTPEAPPSEPLPLELKLLHWPLVQSGWKGIAFLVTLIGVVLLVHNFAKQPAMAPIALMAILLVTTWFWLPVFYVMRASGIERQMFLRRQHIAWVNFESYLSLRDGVKLRPTWSISGGLYISWNGQQALIQRMLDAHIGRARKPTGSSISRGSSKIM